MRSAAGPIVGRGPQGRGALAPSSQRAAPAALAEVGVLFRDLRRALRLPLPELARRLATRLDVLEALETGDAQRLPPWPETVRVVKAFTALGRIDPAPVLAILRQATSAPAPPPSPAPRNSRTPWSRLAPVAHAARSAAAYVRTTASQATHTAARAPWTGWLSIKRPVGRRGILALGVLSLGLFAYIAQAGTLGSIMSSSSPLSRLARAIEDRILWLRAPVRDGLRWIDVDDPRSRRGDKLDSAHR